MPRKGPGIFCVEPNCTEVAWPFVRCAEHRRRVCEHVKATFRRKKAAGLCAKCQESKLPHSMFCTKHRDERLASDRAKARPCSACGAPEHTSRDHRRLGLCAQCGEPSSPNRRNLCDKHTEESNALIARRVAGIVATGMCRKCRRKPIAPRSVSRCEDCLVAAAEGQRNHRN